MWLEALSDGTPVEGTISVEIFDDIAGSSNTRLPFFQSCLPEKFAVGRCLVSACY